MLRAWASCGWSGVDWTGWWSRECNGLEWNGVEYRVVLDCEKGCVSSNRNNHDLESRIISLDRRLRGERGVVWSLTSSAVGKEGTRSLLRNVTERSEDADHGSWGSCVRRSGLRLWVSVCVRGTRCTGNLASISQYWGWRARGDELATVAETLGST